MISIDPSLIQTVTQRLRQGKRLRRRLPGGGWLHIDRPLPFLCVYRKPEGRPDPGTRQLVVAEGSFLLASGAEALESSINELVRAVATSLSDQFEAMLLIELWSGSATEATGASGMPQPCFQIVMLDEETGRATAAAFARALRRVRVLGQRAGVDVVTSRRPVPPGMPPLLTTSEAGRLGVLMLGLQVPPVYQDPETGQLFPRVLRQLHRGLSRALQRASFRFAHLETSHRPDHYRRLGQRRVLKVVWEADEQLASVADDFNLLLAVTPVNASEAFHQFQADGYRREPKFHYRLLNFDPDVLKRRLYAISLERVEDPALGELFRDKREELDRQISLLHDRNSEKFLYGSLQLYGSVDDTLLRRAEEILQSIPAPGAPGQKPWAVHGGRMIDAATFARRAREEIAHYRQHLPGMDATVELRDDVAGLLVARGQLLVSQDLEVAEHRLEPLIQHEVGTHVLTWYNAAAQPLKLLRIGLPGYDELQEGTAVLAEYMVGGLSPGRMRLLAARVLAVRRLVERRSFLEVFNELHEGHGFGASSAFATTMRTFRGGGFTKDAVYLRGLVNLLQYLQKDGEVEPLFLGKVSEASLPIVRELRWRGVLHAPPLQPRYLGDAGAAGRWARLRAGATLADLVAVLQEP